MNPVLAQLKYGIRKVPLPQRRKLIMAVVHLRKKEAALKNAHGKLSQVQADELRA